MLAQTNRCAPPHTPGSGVPPINHIYKNIPAKVKNSSIYKSRSRGRPLRHMAGDGGQWNVTPPHKNTDLGVGKTLQPQRPLLADPTNSLGGNGALAPLRPQGRGWLAGSGDGTDWGWRRMCVCRREFGGDPPPRVADGGGVSRPRGSHSGLCPRWGFQSLGVSQTRPISLRIPAPVHGPTARPREQRYPTPPAPVPAAPRPCPAPPGRTPPAGRAKTAGLFLRGEGSVAGLPLM